MKVKCPRCGDFVNNSRPHSKDHCIMVLQTLVETYEEMLAERKIPLDPRYEQMVRQYPALLEAYKKASYELGQVTERRDEMKRQLDALHKDKKTLSNSEMNARILELRKKGLTHEAIADRLGYERSMVSHRLRRMGYAKPRRTNERNS